MASIVSKTGMHMAHVQTLTSYILLVVTLYAYGAGNQLCDYVVVQLCKYAFPATN